MGMFALRAKTLGLSSDECASLVFFNQSTMRHGPATGSDTLAQAKSEGHSRKVDYGTSVREAFAHHVIFKPIRAEDPM
ncbi:hypothetical protein C8F04DRAFT_1133721 [Mycena alexandri]|uniref:Uncharacterized protein n=1 Tax=Mycena alexandri TaxID=1745969 RepID=A0AAD6S9T7_9AGAR|nr:hypothetical protein C8F04DRAFT_1133721 [Mycena alexandri]